jgi:hypothetical protein
MNWLERARQEILGRTPQRTANTADGNATAVTAVLVPAAAVRPGASIGSNGSAAPWSMSESETLREAFEERAAVREFDGNQTRAEAELDAWLEASATGRAGNSR